jgi:hypothetical protein
MWIETFGSRAPAGAGSAGQRRFQTRPKMVSASSKLSESSSASSRSCQRRPGDEELRQPREQQLAG